MNEPESLSAAEEIIIETEEGAVVGEVTEMEKVSQEVVPVNVAESRQFADWAAKAVEFLNVYGPPESDNELKQYDGAFKAWQGSKVKKYSDQEVINLLGAYLGQRLVQDLDMEWVMVTDKYGQDYAVQHKVSKLMGFPFSSVMKRIEDGESDFLHGVYHILKNELEKGDLDQREE
ncbi:DUF3806 domain-containing protein [Roseibacillus persicicus]|uniref:DUF3806 domain-containing protein n=1 Tax=Roseibacillus persicicus TaxID=454148 RepID=UPI00280DE69F|nr:DUF3806 domain-containing protein [Roseibacillus persicicus]MDQ8192669.1 DUF3806 domain-containing protein [Roseibacillus persicicus]